MKVGSLRKGFHHGGRDQQSGEHIAVFVQKTDISNKGCSALTSHASGKKHSEISGLKSLNVGNTFFKSLGSSETSIKPTSSQQTVDSMVVPVSALRAEVLWVLKVVKNDFLLNSCLDMNDLS